LNFSGAKEIWHRNNGRNWPQARPETPVLIFRSFVVVPDGTIITDEQKQEALAAPGRPVMT
jgi:hypothetical protein